MKQLSLENELKNNAYPGRGIVVGKTPDGTHAVIAYFIMGRSTNSRNRVFVTEGEGIRTEAFDASRLEDPSLIIYAPVRVLGNKTIVTNGDQTDTIYDGMDNQLTFEQSLRSREFEPDGPNYTPRISGVATYTGSDFTYELSILKSSDEKGSGCERFFFSYPSACSVGHLIHTYEEDGQPLPAFTGEPRKIVIPEGLGTLTEELWQALDEENKVSLFVIQTNPDGSDPEVRIINKNQK